MFLSFLDSFNTQPPEGGWLFDKIIKKSVYVSTHSRPKAAGSVEDRYPADLQVSTHSRPKAAGQNRASACPVGFCFNTQPPEGGWSAMMVFRTVNSMFQHTAARRRLEIDTICLLLNRDVSTHSRPKAAGMRNHFPLTNQAVSTHSRPKAAGRHCAKSMG